MSDEPNKVFTGREDIPDKLHSICENCIKNCREKYSGFTADTEIYYEDGFGVECPYIPHDEVFYGDKVKEHIKSNFLSAEEATLYNNTKSALLWAESKLIDPESLVPWTAWPHQRKALLCRAPYKVYRWGRRTGKSVSLAVEILWYALTIGGGEIRDPKTGKLRTNLNILLLAPQKTHVANIFDRIRAFISQVPEIANSQSRNVQGSPQVIAFNIGSNQIKISGFASGQGSGNEALGARGQDADLVVLDEAAYVLPTIIEAVINPILYTKSHTRFIVSSTPSGHPNDWFESVCRKRPDFVEFYVPASDRPDWAEVEDRVKRDFAASQEKWDLEVMALFSVAGEGVYKEELIRFAQSNFSYGDFGLDANFVYTFGVDWNKEHGTEIVVLATQKGSPHVSLVVYAQNLPKKEWTNTLGTSRVAELNRIWQPAWIYVDAGGGSGGSILRDFGRSKDRKHPLDSRLADIVKDYNFGSSFEIREANGQTKKVHAKPFMVEHSVHKFELQEVKFPRDDLVIQRQLENYIIERRSPVTGIPVYGLKEKKWLDHRLDALNLALVAVRLEFTSFYQDGVAPIVGTFAFFPDRTAERAVKREAASIVSAGGRPQSSHPRRLPQSGQSNVIQSDRSFSGIRVPFAPNKRSIFGR